MKPLPPLIWGKSLWGQSAFAPVAVERKHNSMVVLNTSILTFLEQIAKADDVIGKCSDPAQAPSLGEELTAFVAAQAAYKAANDACESAKTDCKAKTAARKAAQKDWNGKFKALGSKIETVTGGELEAVLLFGLDVKAAPVPEQPIEEAPSNLRVMTNGTPGRTIVKADPLPGSLLFVVEACADPITAEGWDEVARQRKPSCTVEGAEPGKKTWFRMAAINGQGQGPWSDPVARPVM